jgi:hypothetical protein
MKPNRFNPIMNRSVLSRKKNIIMTRALSVADELRRQYTIQKHFEATVQRLVHARFFILSAPTWSMTPYWLASSGEK